jgi:hypothetical protein
MKQILIFSTIVLFACSTNDKTSVVIESELGQSTGEMMTRLDASFDCFKRLLIDTDSSYNSAKPMGHTQLFYVNFLNLKNTRDSIINIEESLTKKDWLYILAQFSVKGSRLAGTERAKEKIEKDLKFVEDNLDDIPETDFGGLYKHIIERWMTEIYRSTLSNMTIDFIEGYQPPCSFWCNDDN